MSLKDRDSPQQLFICPIDGVVSLLAIPPIGVERENGSAMTRSSGAGHSGRIAGCATDGVDNDLGLRDLVEKATGVRGKASSSSGESPDRSCGVRREDAVTEGR